MEDRQYQIILSVLALAGVLVVAVGIASIATSDWTESGNLAAQAVQLVGYCLLPVAAIGLWWWRQWGFWTLGVATAVTVAATLPEGLTSAIWRSFLHLTTILLIAEHYFARKEGEPEQESDQSH